LSSENRVMIFVINHPFIIYPLRLAYER